jgi:hypothetical protein
MEIIYLIFEWADKQEIEHKLHWSQQFAASQ